MQDSCRADAGKTQRVVQRCKTRKKLNVQHEVQSDGIDGWEQGILDEAGACSLSSQSEAPSTFSPSRP